MSKEPSEQKDTKTPMALLEEYLMNQVRHESSRMLEDADRNDFVSASIRQQILKTHIKTLNWLKNRKYIGSWRSIGVSEYIKRVQGKNLDTCSPPQACATHGRCWSHGEWVGKMTEIAEQKKCVHTEHCCKAYGCKYGEDENCPVVNGSRRQSYVCHCENNW